MRSILFSFTALILLGACAHEGVVVKKIVKSAPFYHTLGIESLGTFVLRDGAGVLHSQMVTPDVFNRYEIGDYFNDLQPGNLRRNPDDSDAKVVRTAARAKPSTASRVAKNEVRRATRGSRGLATRKKSRPVPVVARRNASSVGENVVWIAQRPQGEFRGGELAVVTVSRCR